MIQGRRYLSTVSLLVFTMESARTYTIRTHYCLRTDDTHKSWIAEGPYNLPLTTPLLVLVMVLGGKRANI